MLRRKYNLLDLSTHLAFVGAQRAALIEAFGGLKEATISLGESEILLYIGQRRNGVFAGEISDYLSLKQAHVSRVITYLMKNGFLTTKRVSIDVPVTQGERGYRDSIFLTPHGKSVYRGLCQGIVAQANLRKRL